jgi:hypothetical protein
MNIKESKLSRNEEILSTAIDGDMVFMSIETGNYYSSNEVAGRIWEMLAEPQTLVALVENLQNEYEVEPDTCLEETRALINQMAENGLIHIG